MKNIKYIVIIIFSLVIFTSCKDTKTTTTEEVKTEYTPLTKEEVNANLKDKDIDPEYKKRLMNLISMMEDHPKSAKLYAERANLFVLMKKTTQALSDISMAVDLDPKNSDYHTNKSQLLRQFKRNKDALLEIQKAIELDPSSVGAHFNRGALLFNMNNFQKALEDFTFCIDARPEVGPPYFNRAFTYEQLHDIKSASADLKKFQEISDNEEWKKIAQGKIDEWEKIDYKIIVKDKDRLKSMGMEE